MIRQAGLMLSRKEYKQPLYRLRQNEYCILLDFEGKLEKKLELSNYTSDYSGDYLGFEETK